MTPEEKREAQRQADMRWRARNPDGPAKASRAWRERHPEYQAARNQQQLNYAARNREQEKARAAKWRADNPAREKTSKREYYLRNREARIAASGLYAKQNREKVRAWQQDRSARKRAGGGKLSRGRADALFLEQSGRCAACRRDLNESGRQIDHIVPISRGGSHCDSNVQLLCPTCNKRKSAKDFATFLKELEVPDVGL